MGIGKTIIRGAEKTGDFAHACGVGFKEEVLRLPDRVAVTPEDTATLWRTTPSIHPPTPVQPAPKNPAPVPPLYPVKGKENAQYAACPPQSGLSNWYKPRSGKLRLNPPRLSGQLIEGESWEAALRNTAEDPKRHEVKWRYNGEDLVRGRLSGHVATTPICAATVISAHHVLTSNETKTASEKLMNKRKDQLSRSRAAARASLNSVDVWQRRVNAFQATANPLIRVRQWATKNKLAAEQKEAAANLVKKEKDRIAHANAVGQYHADKATYIEGKRQLYTLLTAFPDKTVREWVTNFKLHGIVNSEMLAETIPKIAAMLSTPGVQADDVLSAGALLVATYMRKDPQAKLYFRQCVTSGGPTSIASGEIQAVKQHTKAVARAFEVGGDHVPCQDALRAQVEILANSDESLGIFLKTFQQIYASCATDQQKGSAMAMLVAGIELYGKQKIKKYQKHGDRISVVLQLLGGATAAMPLGAGLPISALVILGDALVKHAYDEGQHQIENSMSVVIGKIKAARRGAGTTDEVAKLDRFLEDFDIASDALAKDVNPTRNR